MHTLHFSFFLITHDSLPYITYQIKHLTLFHNSLWFFPASDSPFSLTNTYLPTNGLLLFLQFSSDCNSFSPKPEDFPCSLFPSKYEEITCSQLIHITLFISTFSFSLKPFLAALIFSILCRSFRLTWSILLHQYFNPWHFLISLALLFSQDMK